MWGIQRWEPSREMYSIPVKTMTDVWELFPWVPPSPWACIHTSIHPFVHAPTPNNTFIMVLVYARHCLCPEIQWPKGKYKIFPSHLVSRSGSSLAPQVIELHSGSFFSLPIYSSTCSFHHKRELWEFSLSLGTWNSWFQEPSLAGNTNKCLTIPRVKVNGFLNDIHKDSNG